jgi:hypothetical protein
MSNEMNTANAGQGVSENVKGIYDVLAGKQAPAQIGKPVHAHIIEKAARVGARTMADLFGHREVVEGQPGKMRSINFGSKSETASLTSEERLALFDLKKTFNDCEIVAQIMCKTGNPSTEQIMSTDYFKRHFEPKAKAFNVTDFSTWIPTTHTRFYFEEFEIPHILADKFDTVPMDSATMYVPGALGLLKGREEADNATFDEQANTQDGFTVYSRNNVTHSKITEDINQDSAPAIIDKMRREVAAGAARAYEEAIISGDITGSPRGASHMDSDIAAAGKHFCKTFNGMRKIAFAAAGAMPQVIVDHKGDTASKALFAKMLKAMGRFASEKSDLMWVFPSSIATDLVTGAIPELFTAFAFGGLASNVTGQVPPVFGVNGVETMWLREDMNASGVYEASATKTAMILIKKSRFSNFLRAALRIWAAPSLPNQDLMLMTAKIRQAWAGTPQNARETSIVMGYNIETVS